jgi:quinol monooxygenase YgiN
MSVVIVGKFAGDTGKFRQALVDRASEFVEISDRAKSVGAIHHRFGVGDGFVMIIDEWESADQFEKFFSDPNLQAFVGSIGADPGPPELIIAEAVSSPDQF